MCPAYNVCEDVEATGLNVDIDLCFTPIWLSRLLSSVQCSPLTDLVVGCGGQGGWVGGGI